MKSKREAIESSIFRLQAISATLREVAFATGQDDWSPTKHNWMVCDLMAQMVDEVAENLEKFATPT